VLMEGKFVYLRSTTKNKYTDDKINFLKLSGILLLLYLYLAKYINSYKIVFHKTQSTYKLYFTYYTVDLILSAPLIHHMQCK